MTLRRSCQRMEGPEATKPRHSATNTNKKQIRNIPYLTLSPDPQSVKKVLIGQGVGDETKLQRIVIGAVVQHPLEELFGARPPEDENLIPGIHGHFGTV